MDAADEKELQRTPSDSQSETGDEGDSDSPGFDDYSDDMDGDEEGSPGAFGIIQRFCQRNLAWCVPRFSEALADWLFDPANLRTITQLGQQLEPVVVAAPCMPRAKQLFRSFLQRPSTLLPTLLQLVIRAAGVVVQLRLRNMNVAEVADAHGPIFQAQADRLQVFPNCGFLAEVEPQYEILEILAASWSDLCLGQFVAEWLEQRLDLFAGMDDSERMLNTMEIVLADEHFRKFLALYGGSLEASVEAPESAGAVQPQHEAAASAASDEPLEQPSQEQLSQEQSRQAGPDAAALSLGLESLSPLLDQGRRRHIAGQAESAFAPAPAEISAPPATGDVSQAPVTPEMGALLWKELPALMAAHRRHRGQNGEASASSLDCFDVMRISAAVVAAAQHHDFVALEQLLEFLEMGILGPEMLLRLADDAVDALRQVLHRSHQNALAAVVMPATESLLHRLDSLGYSRLGLYDRWYRREAANPSAPAQD